MNVTSEIDGLSLRIYGGKTRNSVHVSCRMFFIPPIHYNNGDYMPSKGKKSGAS
jgi:hypothetical protein